MEQWVEHDFTGELVNFGQGQVVSQVHAPSLPSDHYPRALEATLKSQQSELEKCRQQIEQERRCRIDAERREEATKTELINARSTYALKLAEQRACHAEELEGKVEERLSRAKDESRQHLDMVNKRCVQLESDLSSTRKRLNTMHQEYDERLRKECNDTSKAIEEGLQKAECLSVTSNVFSPEPGTFRCLKQFLNAGDLTEARTHHIDELRSAMETRAFLERRNSWWTNVVFVAAVLLAILVHKLHSCQVQVQSASTITQSLVADERAMQAEIIRLKESLSDILETHYVSVQISRVARLHQEIITTMVACDVHIQMYNEAESPQI